MVSFTSQEMKPQNNHHLQKSAASRIIKKPPTLTPASTDRPQQPKVYKVKPIHFRELVQKLTGAQHQPQLQTRAQTQTETETRRSNLQSIAPPPLPLHPHQLHLRNETKFSIVEEKVAKVEQKSWMDNGIGSTELTLSPNFQFWFSSALLTPGSVSPFEQKSIV